MIFYLNVSFPLANDFLLQLRTIEVKNIDDISQKKEKVHLAFKVLGTLPLKLPIIMFTHFQFSFLLPLGENRLYS